MVSKTESHQLNSCLTGEESTIIAFSPRIKRLNWVTCLITHKILCGLCLKYCNFDWMEPIIFNSTARQWNWDETRSLYRMKQCQREFLDQMLRHKCKCVVTGANTSRAHVSIILVFNASGKIAETFFTAAGNYFMTSWFEPSEDDLWTERNISYPYCKNIWLPLNDVVLYSKNSSVAQTTMPFLVLHLSDTWKTIECKYSSLQKCFLLSKNLGAKMFNRCLYLIRFVIDYLLLSSILVCLVAGSDPPRSDQIPRYLPLNAQ